MTTKPEDMIEHLIRVEHGIRGVHATNLLQLMADEVAACNIEKGWYDVDRTFGDDIALLHSELSEALEAFRQWDVCPMEKHTDGSFWDRGSIQAPTPKPEGVGSELADVLVRLLDTCKRYDIDLFAEWRLKVNYNWSRPYRHGDKAL